MSAIAAMSALLLAAGCSADQDAGEDPQAGETDEATDTTPDPGTDGDDGQGGDDGSTDPDGQDTPGSDDPGEGGDDTTADGPDVRLVTDPDCVGIGERFTATADGLEPETVHIVGFEPSPSTTGEFEPAIPAMSDEDGAIEVSATLPEDAGIEPGDYELLLATETDGDIDTRLSTTALRIADPCDP